MAALNCKFRVASLCVAQPGQDEIRPAQAQPSGQAELTVICKRNGKSEEEIHYFHQQSSEALLWDKWRVPATEYAAPIPPINRPCAGWGSEWPIAVHRVY